MFHVIRIPCHPLLRKDYKNENSILVVEALQCKTPDAFMIVHARVNRKGDVMICPGGVKWSFNSKLCANRVEFPTLEKAMESVFVEML